MLNSIYIASTIIFLLWLTILTIFFVRSAFFSRRLTKEGKSKSVGQLLETILKNQEDSEKVLTAIQSRIADVEKDGELHLQKMGMLRFNPFKDTGGDQSFILVLVDKQNTGVIISSLHTRTGTRWYAKKVEKGRGVEYELSDEEKKALKEASNSS